MKKCKTGLLFPRSALYPGIGFDVTTAFRAGLAHAGMEEGELVTDSIGIGGMGKEVYEKAEQMLLQEQVDILVCYLDHFAAEMITPLAAAANRILIVIDPGASVPVDWTASPLRFHLTLDAAFGSRVTGRLAATQAGPKGLFATSFYDGGYLNCNALITAYNEYGGNICFNYVAPFRFEDFDIRPLQDAMEQWQPDALLGQLSIDMGALFLKDFKKAGLAGTSAFFAAPFLLEETFLDTLAFPFDGIAGCVPWARQLDYQMNQVFQTAMDNAGRTANCFGALAWDAALFTAKVAEALASHRFSGAAAAASLTDCALDGTRGSLQLDRQTNYFTAPLYQASLVPGTDGYSALQLTGMPDFLEEEWAVFTRQPTSGVFSRWTNTYLCTT